MVQHQFMTIPSNAITKLKSFEIASLNLNSLLKHIYELRLQALLNNSSVDILAINELSKLSIYLIRPAFWSNPAWNIGS